jgi:3-isopropylmalate dehydratase small subunit
MNFVFKAPVRCLGDNIDTDAILPARYLNLTDVSDLRIHCMEDTDPEFHRRVQVGDILAAGKNFGCGSSREHAPLALMGCGFSCIVAMSFSRLFYRNAINIGLPVISIDDTSGIAEGNILEVECVSGMVKDITAGKEYAGTPLPDFLLEIMASRGLIPYLEKRLKSRRAG